jgi:organic hydroperoxide reductase OsmC/OhrA
MTRTHSYPVTVSWTGNRGTGTSSYRDYDRAHLLRAEGRADIESSSDPTFRGDPSRWNPELLLVGAAAQCHMLWYLHLCSVNGVVVTAYEDNAVGAMAETADGGGAFTEVVLRPEITVAEAGMVEPAERLHAEAHKLCFIANSLNFPVRHEPVVRVAS